MTLPANLRTNFLVNFPTYVQGLGAVVVSKVNGIWSIALNYGAMAPQAPPSGQQAFDYVLVWDSVAGNYFLYPLSSMTGSIPPSMAQRSVTSGPVTIGPADRVLNLNLTTPTTITLPGYVGRNGLDVIFKDVGKQCFTNNVTINAAVGETIDGFASIVMNVNGMSVKLVPFNDGVNVGWEQI